MKRNREVGGRLPYSEPLLHTLLRLLIGGGVLLCGLLLAQRLPNPDLFGDYVAACAWWQRLPEHLWLAGLSRCDANVDYNAFGPGAHPPFSTVFFLPLGFLAWTDARLAWLIISGACLIGVWHYYRVPVSVCAATALFGVFGLYRGTMEPFLFALMMVALSQEEERPLFSAALIGLAAAIKVYPVLMLAALVIARRLNALIAGIVTGGLATAAGEVVLGIGKTGAWMGHMTPNALAWRINPDNLSLVRIAGDFVPQLSPLVVAVALFGAAVALLINAPHGQVRMHTLVPTTLLVTPLVWSHYIVHTGLLQLTRLEQVLLFAGSGLIFLGILGIFPFQSAAIAYGPVLAALVLIWHRAWRSGTELSVRKKLSGAAPSESSIPNC